MLEDKKVKKNRVVLINPNTIKPLVAPIALDYLATALSKNGHHVDILDLSFAPIPKKAVVNYFERCKADVAGITIRNTDDCYYASQEFFIPRIKEIVKWIKILTEAPVVVGGCGFSIMPERIIEYCSADFGIKGDGEESFNLLIEALSNGDDYSAIPGLVFRTNGQVRVNKPKFLDTDKMVCENRKAINNGRYFREGGQGNIETKRGCSKNCIYCADPLAKGSRIRLKNPKNVLLELEDLYSQGIDCFHVCDSEFNFPMDHALAVCEEIIDSTINGNISWYTYASPALFTEELALLMKKAGCAGIDFGVDSGNDSILQSLGRDFAVEDIIKTARICKKVGIPFMYDLLLGAPGETRESIHNTIGLMKQIDPSRVGISLGIRIYPGTKLAEMVSAEGLGTENGNLHGSVRNNDDFFRPVFYLSAEVGKDIGDYLDRLIGDDKRFFFANPNKKNQNYNYNDNQILVDAVHNGYRGAYWDILRRLAEER